MYGHNAISLLCLTKKEVWQHSSDLQLPGGVEDVTQHFLSVCRVFYHGDGGALPGLNDATAAQCCHPCALLPETCSGKTLNLLSQRLHDRAGCNYGVQRRRLRVPQASESGEQIKTGC